MFNNLDLRDVLERSGTAGRQCTSQHFKLERATARNEQKTVAACVSYGMVCDVCCIILDRAKHKPFFNFGRIYFQEEELGRQREEMQRKHDEDMEKQKEEFRRHEEEIAKHKEELTKHNEARVGSVS